MEYYFLLQKLLQWFVVASEELLQIILYGHDNLPYDSNSKVLAMTIWYIHDSKHFERMTTISFSDYF